MPRAHISFSALFGASLPHSASKTRVNALKAGGGTGRGVAAKRSVVALLLAPGIAFCRTSQSFLP
jgi:hypothetical protein